jgi:hypothetical protein
VVTAVTAVTAVTYCSLTQAPYLLEDLSARDRDSRPPSQHDQHDQQDMGKRKVTETVEASAPGVTRSPKKTKVALAVAVADADAKGTPTKGKRASGTSSIYNLQFTIYPRQHIPPLVCIPRLVELSGAERSGLGGVWSGPTEPVGASPRLGTPPARP